MASEGERFHAGTIDFRTFAARARESGVGAVDLGNGHWRIEGAEIVVDWFPKAAEAKAYVSGAERGFVCLDARQVIRMALGNRPAVPKERSLAQATCRTKRLRRPRWNRTQRVRLLLEDPHCYWCHRALTWDDSTIDHLIPLSKGGENRKENVRLACHPCNQKRGASVAEPPQ